MLHLFNAWLRTKIKSDSIIFEIKKKKIQKAPLEGWLISDLSTTKTISPSEDPDSGTLYVGNYELPGLESYYWLAPTALGQNRIDLYGGMSITFTVGWEAMRGDTSGQPTVGPNLILVVNDLLLIRKNFPVTFWPLTS